MKDIRNGQPYLIEKECKTLKEAMRYETNFIEGCIASGHDLVNVMQRKVVAQTTQPKTKKGKYNPYPRYRQPERWYPLYPAIEV